MKQMTKLGIMMILGLIMQDAQSMSALNQACPEKYIATVTNVNEINSQALVPKVEVEFQVIQTLKGEKIISKKMQVAKDGPIQFKNGEIYTLEVNDIWLCSATVFSKI